MEEALSNNSIPKLAAVAHELGITTDMTITEIAKQVAETLSESKNDRAFPSVVKISRSMTHK